ncbi:MAG: DUF429 domain-containing protein [Phycisphaerales bacterium]
MIVAGADGCRSGWVVALGTALKTKVRFQRAVVVETLDEIESFPQRPALLAVDIPIGLAERAEPGGRACDRMTRELLGVRKASVFSPPIRPVLSCATYREALEVSRASSEHALGLSKQSWNITPKIREADAYAHRATIDVIEAHPELAFAQMIGEPMTHPKKSASGSHDRREALESVMGPVPERRIGDHHMDDLLDACACLWTAWRASAGRVRRVGPDEGPWIHA